MKPLLEGMKAAGADQDTLNFFMRAFTVFVIAMGLGSMILAGVIVATGGVPPIWLVALVTTIGGVGLTLLTSTHQTSVINGTAAQAATDNQKNVAATLEQAKTVADTNAATIQAIMAIVSNMSTTNATSGPLAGMLPLAENSKALEENTAATILNTGESKV